MCNINGTEVVVCNSDSGRDLRFMEQDDMEHVFRNPRKQKSPVPDSKKIRTYGSTIYSSGTEIPILAHHVIPQKILARWIFVISLHLFQINCFA